MAVGLGALLIATMYPGRDGERELLDEYQSVDRARNGPRGLEASGAEG